MTNKALVWYWLRNSQVQVMTKVQQLISKLHHQGLDGIERIVIMPDQSRHVIMLDGTSFVIKLAEIPELDNYLGNRIRVLHARIAHLEEDQLEKSMLIEDELADIRRRILDLGYERL